MAGDGCRCGAEGEAVGVAARVVEEVAGRLGPRFRRPEAHCHAADYLRGLIADVERKNGWQLAERAGYAHPRGIQRVLDRYAWDDEAVRDDLRAFVAAELGDPAGVLVVDETGFPKQGKGSAGVARQYCGTLGKVANCQVGVFLGYAGPAGRAAIDRALFVPAGWFADPDRVRAAGIPEGLAHRTKPQLALAMLERALDAGVPAGWVTADEVYGSDGKLRRALEERGQAYVLAVRGNERPTTWPPHGPPGQAAAADLVAALPPATWVRLNCGEGAQGPRVYDWAYLPLRPALGAGWVHALLARRHPARPAEVAHYLVFAPEGTPLAEVVRVAGSRWAIEELFKLAKGQVGLDHYEVRSWRGWHRHVTLALLALAALAVAAAKGGAPRAPSTSRSPSPRSAACSSASPGPPPAPRPPSSRGRAGDGGTNGRPSGAIAAVA